MMKKNVYTKKINLVIVRLQVIFSTLFVEKDVVSCMQYYSSFLSDSEHYLKFAYQKTLKQLSTKFSLRIRYCNEYIKSKKSIVGSMDYI